MATRSKLPRKTYHHGDLRNALLTAARDVLEERGPSYLSLREIARRVGVTAPAAYHHFPSRDALALGLVEAGAREMAGVIAATAADDTELLLPYGEAYVAFARANPALYRLMFGEGLPAETQSSDAVRDLRQRSYDIMVATLAPRLPPSELHAAALFLWSVVHGLSLLLIDRQIHAAEDPDAIVRQVLRLAGTGAAGKQRRGPPSRPKATPR